MSISFNDKDLMRMHAISMAKLYCKRLLTNFYRVNGELLPGLSQLELASELHLTQSQMSRVVTGVCCPSTPVFLKLRDLCKKRFGIDYTNEMEYDGSL